MSGAANGYRASPGCDGFWQEAGPGKNDGQPTRPENLRQIPGLAGDIVGHQLEITNVCNQDWDRFGARPSLDGIKPVYRLRVKSLRANPIDCVGGKLSRVH